MFASIYESHAFQTQLRWGPYGVTQQHQCQRTPISPTYFTHTAADIMKGISSLQAAHSPPCKIHPTSIRLALPTASAPRNRCDTSVPTQMCRKWKRASSRAPSSRSPGPFHREQQLSRFSVTHPSSYNYCHKPQACEITLGVSARMVSDLAYKLAVIEASTPNCLWGSELHWCLDWELTVANFR